MKLDHLLRALAVGSVLMAGSCAVANNGESITEDGVRNHPIAVEPSYRDLKLEFTGAAEGMSAQDAGKFDAFVADYRVHGNGMLSISVPSGASSRAAITFFAERAAASGISRDKILVSTREAGNSDPRVDVSYITYTARADSCGDWSENLAFSGDNLTPKNFGCSIQHNIAAMVANPRDLLGPGPSGPGPLGPGPMGPVDTNRRAIIMDHYEKGEVTQADKHTADKAVEQSAGASTVGNGN